LINKQAVYEHYYGVITNNINRLQLTLADLKNSAANETKSTAGDKHETALAMLQIEQANTSTQLQDATQQLHNLEKIKYTIASKCIVNGSLIKTTNGFIYLSLAMGKAIISHIQIIAISPQSPLGAKLMGLRVGDTATINNKKFTIEAIY
jgi:hypothetical protein